MSNQDDLDFELVDDIDEDDQDEEITTSDSDDDSKTDDEEDTTSTKSKKTKNSSNWKKVTKVNKALQKENEELRKKLAKHSGKDEDDIDEDDDDEESFVNSTELRLFLVEMPEAKEYKDEIQSIIEESRGTLSFERALALAKAGRPEESESSDDFGTKSSNVKVKKRLQDLTEEEALKLPNDKYLKYQRIKGKIK